MTKVGNLIDTAPEELYPDQGCPSWPTCLDCVFDPCIYTASRTHPTQDQRRTALQRAKIVAHIYEGTTQKEIATKMKVAVNTVQRGIDRYTDDQEKARRLRYGELTYTQPVGAG